MYSLAITGYQQITPKEIQNFKRKYLKRELKELSPHLEYAFLDYDKYPVVISSSLTKDMEERLLTVF